MSCLNWTSSESTNDDLGTVLPLPLKTTSKVDIIRPLEDLCGLKYACEGHLFNYRSPIAELNQMRKFTSRSSLKFNQDSLEMIARYCDELKAFGDRLHLHRQNVSIPFKWKDAFNRRPFTKKTSLTLESISYERVCCLFNLASAQTQVAANCSQEDDEGLQLSTKLLQAASGIFSYLKNHVRETLENFTPDLSPSSLEALSVLTLAEAQELFVVKAIQSKLPNKKVAKLAAQSEELYSEALRKMKKSSVSSCWQKKFRKKAISKQFALHAVAQYYQSRDCNSAVLVGEEIARLQDSIQSFKSAQQYVCNRFAYQDLLDLAQKALDVALTENNATYFEDVPSLQNLQPVEKQPLAKATLLPQRLSTSFKDLFHGLTPIILHNAMEKFDVRRIHVVNKELEKLEEANQVLDARLHSSNGRTSESQKFEALVNQAKHLRRERDLLKKELQSIVVDMKSTFLDDLTANGFISEEVLSERKIEEVYSPLRKHIQESMKSQSSLMKNFEILDQELRANSPIFDKQVKTSKQHRKAKNHKKSTN